MRRCAARPVRPASVVCGLLLATLAAAGCSAPSYRFEATAAGEVVLKLPRSWSLVRSGLPANQDGTPAPAGNWVEVFDAAGRPSLDHAESLHPADPVATLRTVAVSKSVGSGVTDDDLRDVMLPVSEAGRADALLSGFTGTGFTRITDQVINGKAAHGVHVVYTYDLGGGPQVYDQIAVVDAGKTRVHVLFVHCTKVCYDAHRPEITSTVRSFTVKTP